MTIQHARDFLRRVPFNTLLGMRLRSVHRDGITIECELRDELRNSAGAAHGGVAAAMADAAVGIAIQLHFGGKRRITTVEMKINYLEAVARGEVVAEAELVRLGRNLAVVDCDLFDHTRRIVAKALMTFAIISRGRKQKGRPD